MCTYLSDMQIEVFKNAYIIMTTHDAHFKVHWVDQHTKDMYLRVMWNLVVGGLCIFLDITFQSTYFQITLINNIVQR